MALKCCVPNCKSNYASSNDKVPVYKLPQNNKDKKKWIAAIPKANLVVSKYTAVCRKHWPENATFVHVYENRDQKTHLLFFLIFQPAACLRSARKNIPRTTKRSLSSARKHAEDEMKIFLEQDKLDFGKIIDQAPEKFNCVTVYSHEVGSVSIQSKALIHGAFLFIIQIKNGYSYTCFSFGSPCNVVSLKSNPISHCKTWSALSEMMRYLSALEMTHKKKFLFDQLFVTDKKGGNKKLYSLEMTTRAFEYFATSRSLYSGLQQDFQLPSIRTLTRITSKVGKVAETEFLASIFKNLSPCQRRCIILWQWFSTFLVERNPNETFQRLEEPLCDNLIVLCQGVPTSALLWTTFQNYSSLRTVTG